MEPAAMDRLAAVDDLYFPTAFLRAKPSPSPADRKDALLALLARDAPLFLERYGAFDALLPDYEVDWHPRRLRAARGGGARGRRRCLRRRAYLDRLVREGEYSEDAMREREPYLHHEYLGRYQDPLGRAMARPGERWSETLIRRAEEAVIVEKIQGEQIRRGVDPSEWVGGGDEVMQEQEEEEEEEEEEEGEEEEEDQDIKEKGGEAKNLGATEDF